jgi:ferredoxin
MSYIPVIDESACIAHAECEEVLPSVFRVGDGDVATVMSTAPLEQLTAVAKNCPTTAISVIDEESGEQVYP